jgi:hypothetical protein
MTSNLFIVLSFLYKILLSHALLEKSRSILLRKLFSSALNNRYRLCAKCDRFLMRKSCCCDRNSNFSCNFCIDNVYVCPLPMTLDYPELYYKVGYLTLLIQLGRLGSTDITMMAKIPKSTPRTTHSSLFLFFDFAIE